MNILTPKLTSLLLTYALVLFTSFLLYEDNTSEISTAKNRKNRSEQQAIAISTPTVVQTNRSSVKIVNTEESLKPSAAPENIVVSNIAEPIDELTIHYADDDIVDENWQEDFDDVDEETYLEIKNAHYEPMSDSERASMQRIQQLESQLMNTMEEGQPNDEVSSAIVDLFTPEEEQGINPLVDLQCAQALCRIALKLEDENAQYEALDYLSEQMEGWHQSVADVMINADDSRLLTVYMQQLGDDSLQAL